MRTSHEKETMMLRGGGGASALYRAAYATHLLRSCWSRVSLQVLKEGGMSSTCFIQAIMRQLFSIRADLADGANAGNPWRTKATADENHLNGHLQISLLDQEGGNLLR